MSFLIVGHRYRTRQGDDYIVTEEHTEPGLFYPFRAERAGGVWTNNYTANGNYLLVKTSGFDLVEDLTDPENVLKDWT